MFSATNCGRRYAVYQDAWKAWYRRWQAAADWPWPVSQPFVAQHERIVAAAHDHELPMTPLTDRVRRDVFAKGLADAAILANIEPGGKKGTQLFSEVKKRGRSSFRNCRGRI